MKKFYFLVVVSFSICSSFAIASDNPSQDGKDLIEKAADKMNIFALPYFEMKANVRILDNQEKRLEGTYSLLWNGPDKWREEINFAGYTELQLGCHCGFTSCTQPWGTARSEPLAL